MAAADLSQRRGDARVFFHVETVFFLSLLLTNAFICFSSFLRVAAVEEEEVVPREVAEVADSH